MMSATVKLHPKDNHSSFPKNLQTEWILHFCFQMGFQFANIFHRRCYIVCQLRISIYYLQHLKILMETAFSAYKALLQSKPILTKSITCGLLFIVGDYIAQKVENKFHSGWDKQRTANFAIVGTAYYGPALHFWYCKMLPKIALACFAGRTKMFRVLGSLAFDQLLFSPIFYSGYFFVNSIVEQRNLLKGLKKGNKQVRDKIIETMIADVVVWPLATGINLWYVPLQYQVLYTNIICLFWDVALCHITKE